MDKKEKARFSRAEEVTKLIANYIENNDYSDRHTIITVSNVLLNEKLDSAKVYISIFPIEKTISVFSKIQDDRKKIQNYINKSLCCRMAPKIEIILNL